MTHCGAQRTTFPDAVHSPVLAGFVVHPPSPPRVVVVVVVVAEVVPALALHASCVHIGTISRDLCMTCVLL